MSESGSGVWEGLEVEQVTEKLTSEDLGALTGDLGMSRAQAYVLVK